MWSTLKLLFVYVTLGPIAGLLGIPFTLLTGNIMPMYRAGFWIMAAGVRAAGIRVQISGLENMPQGKACILMANHVSNLDPPVLLPSLPGRVTVMLKAELMRIPILGRAMAMAKFVPVERGGHRIEKAQESVSAAAEALRSGLHVVVFPEGTRAKDGRLQPFKKGTFYLAQQTGAWIVPVVVAGTQKMMRKGSWAITPGVATVTFLPAIDPAAFASRDDLMVAVRTAILAALPEEMQPLG